MHVYNFVFSCLVVVGVIEIIHFLFLSKFYMLSRFWRWFLCMFCCCSPYNWPLAVE
jgi:hypothetical protein